jgi:hypothetical protein
MFNVFENDIILDCPNAPTHSDDDNFHEERKPELIFEAYQDIKGIIGVRHKQIQSIQTS